MIALSRLEPFHAVRFDGDIYDTGSKIGFLTANIAYALDRGDLGPQLRAGDRAAARPVIRAGRGEGRG